MLGEHEKAFHSLNEQQGSNDQHLNQVFELLQSIHERLSVSPPDMSPANPPVPPAVRHGVPPETAICDASFPTPDHFSGDINKYGGFLLQRSLPFAHSPRSFTFDSSKISSVVGLLKHRALDWALAFRMCI